MAQKGLLVNSALSPDLCQLPTHAPLPPRCRHKEDVYENLQSKNRREEKVKKQRSADKEKSKGSLKRK